MRCAAWIIHQLRVLPCEWWGSDTDAGCIWYPVRAAEMTDVPASVVIQLWKNLLILDEKPKIEKWVSNE